MCVLRRDAVLLAIGFSGFFFVVAMLCALRRDAVLLAMFMSLRPIVCVVEANVYVVEGLLLRRLRFSGPRGFVGSLRCTKTAPRFPQAPFAVV